LQRRSICSDVTSSRAVDALHETFSLSLLVLGSSSARSIELYNSQTRKWSAFYPSLPNVRIGFNAAVVDKTIYVLGGSDDRDIVHADVHTLKPGAQKWEEVSKMNDERLFFGIGKSGIVSGSYFPQTYEPI
jgi:hypothetical protein